MKNTVDTKVSHRSFELTNTIDCAIFGFSEKKLYVLLVQRAINPYKGYWMLPGGVVQNTQTLESAAAYVLQALTGVTDVYLEQVKAYSDIERHPVKRVVTISFYALVKPENHQIAAKSYSANVRWCPVEDVPPLGFDHNKLLIDALAKLQRELRFSAQGFELLPEKFTLKELQDLYETILGEKLDRRNFRRKISALNILVDTNEKKMGIQGNPSLYKFDKQNFKEEELIKRNII